MLAVLLAHLLSAAAPPAVSVVPLVTDVRGLDRAALAQAVVVEAGRVSGGTVQLAALPAAPCELRCRLDAAQATGAPLALLLDAGLLAESAQVGVVLVELETGRAVAQHAERVPPALATAALARGVRAVFGKVAPGDEAAARAATATHSTSLRVVVAQPKLSGSLGLDAAAAATLSTRAAAVVQREAGFVVVTTDEIAAVLKNDRDQADLGTGNRDVFTRAAAALDARLLLLVDVGAFGDAALVTGRLVDVQLGEAETVRAELVVDDPAQIPAGVDAVVLRLFGRTAPVPPPRAAPSRFEAAVKKVARGLSPAFLEATGRRVVVVPFEERGAVPAQMTIGSSAATLLRRTLSAGLPGPVWLPMPSSATPGNLLEQARALEAQVVVSGVVSDVGTDLMLEASAIDVSNGSVLARQTALFPKGDQATLIPLERLVLKTRGEAMFRALVPGGGQFFNGPEHSWKGVVVATGTGLSLVAGGALLVGALSTRQEAQSYDRGQKNFISLACDINQSPCDNEIESLNAQVTSLSWVGIGAIGAGLLFYTYGFIDAAWSAE